VVFLKDGDGFRAVPVHVEHRDHAVVVIADDGALFEGDPLVTDGAFALALALERGKGGDDAHGHGHSHN
jgi:hypothetical protein